MTSKTSLAGTNNRMSILLLAVCFLGAVTAHSAVIVSVESVTAAAGSSGNAFDVELINPGPAAVAVGGFSFSIVTANHNISFTGAKISTTAAYIFGANSLFGPDLTGPTSGQSLTASDVFNVPLSGIGLDPGNTVGLGHVLFDVSPFATAGTFPVNLEIFPVTSLADPSGNNIGLDAFLPGQITIAGAAAVPEPSSLLMFLTGLALGAGPALRYKKANR